MPRHDIQFDIDKALQDLKDGKPMNGQDGILTPLINQLTEAALKAEQEQHIASDTTPNRKNGYTANAAEAVHHQFRKLTKTKGGFASENSLLKLLYAGVLGASERWTHPVQDWNLTLSQMVIHFEGRLEPYLDILPNPYLRYTEAADRGEGFWLEEPGSLPPISG